MKSKRKDMETIVESISLLLKKMDELEDYRMQVEMAIDTAGELDSYIGKTFYEADNEIDKTIEAYTIFLNTLKQVIDKDLKTY